MDMGRIMGALLGGGATPPRRRGTTARRSAGMFGMTQAETRNVGRVLGALAGVAAEALKQTPPPRPAPAPPPAPTGRKPGGVPDVKPVQPAQRPWEPRPGAEPQAPKDEAAENAEALLLTRAMVAAARADGVTDAAERAAIARQLDAAGLTAAERDRVLADFEKPMAPEELARAARDPMLRAQLYAACVAAMGEISAAEREWLNKLAAALKLDAAAREAIERRLG
jgi:uncharacterized membrane protein YebE (DUF533 family)